MNHPLFHFATRQDWEQAQATREYRPASLEREGFIHLSDASQVYAVWENLYLHRQDLLLLVLDERLFNAPLRWETSGTGAERFPHLYGPLNLDAVTRVIDLSTIEPHVVRKKLKSLSTPSRLLKNIFGVSSMIGGILALLFGSVVLAHTLLLSIQKPTDNPLQQPVYAILTLVSALLALVGGTLGLASLVQEDSKGPGAAGCVLNLLLFVVFCGLAVASVIAAAP